MQYVAFLRGMNLGGRRITNADLCDCFRDLGLQNAWAFLASGNVAFESGASASEVSELIEVGLGDALGYDVPTFLRTADEVATIAASNPFGESLGAAGGKPQVSLLATKPTPSQRKRVLAFATQQDQLAIEGKELYWLPEGSILESDLDMKTIEKTLGTMTTRTQRTLQRLSKKLSAGG